MADTGQGIDVGDAVLTFLGDTTQLDQAFDRVATQAEVKMAKAADSVSQVGDAVDGVTERMAVGQQGAVKLGEITTLAGQKTRASMYEARGETALLGEMFGVHLPRHVRSFVAELPGVGTALSAAFSATAVLFLLEALIKGSEKLSEWISNVFIFTQAMKDSDASTAKFNETLGKLSEQIDKDQKAFDDFGKSADELAHDKLANITKALADNAKAFQEAEKTAIAYAHADEESFWEKMEARIAGINRWLGVELDADEIAALAREGMDAKGIAAQQELIRLAKAAADLRIQQANAAREATVKDVELAEEAAKKRASNERTVGIARIRQEAALATYQARFATDSAAAVLKIKQDEAEKEYQLKLHTLEKERAAEQAAAAGYGKTIKDPNDPNKQVELDKEAAAKQLQLVADTNAKIEALNREHGTKMTEEQTAANDAFATAAVASAKLVYDAQLKGIEDYKKAQLDLYVAGKSGIGSWEAAQIHATDAAAIAHEDYLKRVIAVYTQQGEAQKAQTAQQELEKLQLEDEAKATEKLSAAMAKLTSATKEAKDAERKLAEDTISQHFKDQETAITKLAAMHLITEEQKDNRLKLLEQQQASEALAILDKELKDTQKLRDQAQAKLATAKANPASTSSELTELQAELQKEVAAVTKAEDAKLQAQERFNQASEQNDKSHYGRAYLQAVAYGNELLAEQLKQNHAALLATQQELALAKAREIDTTAIQHKITALKQHEQTLEKEASGNKKVIDAQLQVTKAQLLAAQAVLADAKARGMDTTAIEKQIADLKKLETELGKTRQGTQSLALAISKLKNDTKAAAQEMLSSLTTAFEGIITGQQSFGKAMEEATFKMIGRMANSWGEYFAAMGIADIFRDPPLGGAELAASAALFAISGVMSGLASNAGKGSGSGGVQSGAPTAGQTQAMNIGGTTQQTVGVTRLAAGGVVSKPTMFMAGDSPTGGAADEAILPLSDSGAMQKIISAILPVLPQNAPGFGWATPSQRPPHGFDLSQPSSSDRPDIHSGNPNDGDFERSEASLPRDMVGMEALAASFGGLLSTPTLRAASGARGAMAATQSTPAAPAGFDSNSMEKFADRIGKQVNQGGKVEGDTTHVHVLVKGMISPDNLNKVIKRINRQVANRQSTLNASNSLRVTRRSQ